MRFSIRLLLLIVFLIGLILAAGSSDRPGKRLRRIASIDVAAGGEQLAINLMECNGSDEDPSTRFDRTISTIDYPSLKNLQMIRRDHQQRGKAEDFVFWRQQAAVVHAGEHLLFLDRYNTALLIVHLASRTVSEWARFTEGEIEAFDASPDGGLIVVQGTRLPDWPEGDEIRIDGEVYIVPEDEGVRGMFRKEIIDVPVAMVSNLGIAEPETILVPWSGDEDDVTVLEETPDGDVTSNDTWRVNRPRSIDFVFQPMLADDEVAPQRFLIRPCGKDSGLSDHSIGNVGGAFSLELDADNLQIVGSAHFSERSHYWDSSLFDVAASYGRCRFAKLLSGNQLLLNITSTIAWPIASNVELKIEWPTSPESVLALSPSGRWLAVAGGRTIRVMPTKDVVKANRDVIRTSAPGVVNIVDHPHQSWQHETQVTAIALAADDDYVIVGDDRGRLTKYSIESGEAVQQIEVPGKPRGLPIYVVGLIALFWLWCAVRMLTSRWKTNAMQNRGHPTDDMAVDSATSSCQRRS